MTEQERAKIKAGDSVRYIPTGEIYEVYDWPTGLTIFEDDELHGWFVKNLPLDKYELIRRI